MRLIDFRRNKIVFMLSIFFLFIKIFLQLGPSGRGCYSHVGRVKGKQALGMSNDQVGKGCFRLGAIMHEFLHGK